MSPTRAPARRRVMLVVPFVLAALLLAACAQAATFALQHAVGAAIGPCRASKDSVEAARGAPYRRYVSDQEDVTTHAQVFWHEWAYRATSAENGRTRDSVIVVGFRWGEGIEGCDVRERRAGVPGPRGQPWEGAGEVPGE